jgi:glutamate-1-semialdehyde 2,1-aminomutase
MNGYADTLQVDLGMRDRFIEGMLDAGIYLLPDGRWYVSAAHTEDEVRTTLKIVAELFDRLAMSTRVTTEAGQ